MPSRSLRGALAGLLALAAAAVLAPALHASTAATPGDVLPTTTTTSKSGDPFAGNGQWIWNIPNSDGGDTLRIGARARKADLSYVIVKAANGTQAWPNFTASFVAGLQAQKLKVCGYQRVLNTGPKTQALRLANQVKATGADCAVIDAEAEVEGRYSLATTYMATLRKALGTRFPIALTSFPWIGYHPQFPYSVFLGPNGAQYNLPQIYWKAIGVSVAKAFANTYPANSVYGRPIRPVGQLWQSPSATQIAQFRTTAKAYGAAGISWWDWEETATSGWSALAKPLVAPKADAQYEPPTLAQGANSDLVRWARVRLKSTGAPVSVTTNRFDAKLRASVVAFQEAHGLPVTGAVDPATWALLTPSYR